MTRTANVDPDLALELAKATADAYTQATDELIAIVARQTAAGTDDPDGWAARKLSELRTLQAESRRVVDRLSKQTPGLISTAVRSAYNTGAGIPLATHTRAVDQLIGEATSRVVSTHGQILRSIVDDYRTTISRTSTLAATGAFTIGQARRAALDELAKKGITGFVDKAGRKWRLDRYAEMATRTAVGRAQVAGTLDRLVDDGRDLVIVSDHHGACKVCAPFEGKVLSISGSSTGNVEDGNGDRQPILGSVSWAQSEGLQHPNCRHSMAAFIPGLSVPPEPRESPSDGVERRRAQQTADEQVRAGRRREAARTGKAPKRVPAGGAGGGMPPRRPPAPTPDDEGDGFKPGAWEAAEQLHGRVKGIEKRVTKTIESVARAVGGRTARLDTRFKDLESLARKLSLKTRLPRVGPVPAGVIDDALRYTVVLDDTTYTEGFRQAINQLRENGFTIHGNPQPQWRPNGYKGINLKVTDQTSEVFEVQFQTPGSLQASEDTHGLYEEWRQATTPAARKAELERLINERYRRVRVPPGVTDV